MELRWFRAIVLAFVAPLTVIGCGTIQEGTTEEEEWVDATPVSRTAMLEYRVDSLTRENQKLQQLLNHAVSENQNLNTRNAELESKSSSAAIYITTGGSRSSVQTNPGYESALSKFRNRSYQDAVDEFSALLTAGVSEDLMDNCRYWIGESYFGLRKFDDAIQQFEAVVGIPGSDKADDAQLMIGNAYAAVGNRDSAKKAYQDLISNFPASPLVKRARSKMSGL